MIAFFDTSALVKLFIDELQCDAARAWASQARAIVVSQLAWIEFHAAMALKRRTLQRPVVEIAQAREPFAQSWSLWQRAGVDAALATSAGELAWRHGLRAYDSVQLATALKAAESLGQLLRFCSFDGALGRAAAAEGLVTLGA